MPKPLSLKYRCFCCSPPKATNVYYDKIGVSACLPIWSNINTPNI